MAQVKELINYYLPEDSSLSENIDSLTIEELDQRLIETNKIIDDANQLKLQIEKFMKLKVSSLLLNNNNNPTYYNIHKIAILEENDESDTIERIGGWPSLANNEAWPSTMSLKPLIFVGQFIYNDNILYRIFIDDDAMSNYYRCMPIKLDYLFKDGIPIQDTTSEVYSHIKPLKKYNITGYNMHKEFKPYCEIQHHLNISEELYDIIDIENNSKLGNCATIIPFPKGAIDDKCQLCKISAQLLERPSDGGQLFFFHQERLVYVP
jgi:hypothetical protein